MKKENGIESAVRESLSIIRNADIAWTGMKAAKELVPELAEKKIILKSGPRLPWESLCETQRTGIVNGILFEGWASDRNDAEYLVLEGIVDYAPGNDYGFVCSGAGITTPSMAVLEVTERQSGKIGYCAPFEGHNRGGLGGWGMLDSGIADYLHVIRKRIAPEFDGMLKKRGGILLNPILSSGFASGDEMHSCQDAASTLILKDLLAMLIEDDIADSVRRLCSGFLLSTRRFFHPLDMASAIAMVQPLKGLANSPIVTAMVGNGVEYGIKIGAFGDRWFTAPSPRVNGVGMEREALPWIGDSSMTETVGWGGMASAASPSAAAGIGISFAAASEVSAGMRKICAGENPRFPLWGLDGRGTPCCIDLRKVISSGITPVLHGGRIASDGARLGPGYTEVPMACFEKAYDEFHRKYEA